MQCNNNTDILGFEDFKVTNIEEDKKHLKIYGNHIPNRICPYCGSKHNWVHDHRTQIFKDSPMRGKIVSLYVKKNMLKKQDLIVNPVERDLKHLFLLPAKENK